MPRKAATQILAAKFDRPNQGPTFVTRELPSTGQPAWRSNGGPARGHPAKAFPFSFEASLPDGSRLIRIHLLGTLALYAGRPHESSGSLGASIQLVEDNAVIHHQELVNGRHYADASDLTRGDLINGDGTSLEKVGIVEIDGQTCRVDILTIDVPNAVSADSLRFKDLGSPASFAVFDVFFEVEAPQGCPFAKSAGGISLSEIGPILRIGDRVRFSRALEQLTGSLLENDDLDEARGQALTFLAVVTAAMLEMGGSRDLHREQLAAAREFEGIESIDGIAHAVRRRIDVVASPLFRESVGPSTYLVERALALVERNFARNLNDATVAGQLGLSTSHFRYLFRQATGQPFHKYLIALRLEKARQMLIDEEVSVGAVARAVGFTGLSHFSRAFAQRFGVSPTHVRRSSD